MSLWEAILLGIVQGATEFLPVSSSGHLVIGQELLGVEVEGIVFEVAVHVATLVSVLLVYRQRVADLFLGAVHRDSAALRYIGLILLASIPAAVVGIGFEDAIEALFESPWIIGIQLMITGLLLWSTRAAQRRITHPKEIGPGRAFAIGAAQAVAISPGISRSGSTVVAALWMGVEAREAAAFSFLMSVPAIAGAGLLQIPELLQGTGGVSPGVLFPAMIAAGVSGVLAIRFFIAMLQRRAFHYFAIYCWVVGGAFLAWVLLS